MNEKKAVHAIISGRVQGVFFRMETRRTAERLGVTGWVRNRPDGSVEAIFEGDSEKVDQVVYWCKKGPPAATVTDLQVAETGFTGEFKNFSIRY